MGKQDEMRKQLVDKINSKYGKDSLFIMGKRADITAVQALPTGSLALDNAIGVGGFPRGRIVEVFGPEAAGKSLILLSAIAQTQQAGGSAAFIDAEHALSPDFAELLGVDTKKLYYVQPDSGEKALSIMEDLIASHLFDIVGLDSVAALITEEELTAGYDDKKPAYTAIMMSRALKKMTSIISKTKTVAVFINQIREKPMTFYGSPEYTTGGKALKFYSSLRIDTRKTGKVIDEIRKVQTGHTVKCRVIKNKVAPPFNTCEIKLDYTMGIDRVADLINTAVDLKVIGKNSSWYEFGGKKWNGEKAMLAELQENDELLNALMEVTRGATIGQQGTPGASEEDTGEDS